MGQTSLMKKIQLSIIVLVIMIAFLMGGLSGFAMMPAEQDIVPAVGQSTKQLYWRSYKVTFVNVQGSKENIVEYYESPSESSTSFGGTGEKESWKYIETNGDYYGFLSSFPGASQVRIGYVNKVNAKKQIKSQRYLIRKAGKYMFSLKNSDSSIRSSEYYYVKASKGKTGKIIISSDKAGKNVIKSETFTDGLVIYGNDGQYISITNAELASIDIAPTTKIKAFITELSESKPLSDDKVEVTIYQ